MNARVQAASQAFTRLSRKIWKSGALSERSKVKAFCTLVLPLLLYATECLLLTKQQETKLERWQTKQLWKIVRGRSDFGKMRPASDQLRERCQCPTIVSVIRQRRLALWKSVLTQFERLNDDRTIACRKTWIGELSFEHRFPHQTARRTQMQEDIRQCIQSQEKDQGST